MKKIRIDKIMWTILGKHRGPWGLVVHLCDEFDNRKFITIS